jgi:hypothetical protein
LNVVFSVSKSRQQSYPHFCTANFKQRLPLGYLGVNIHGYALFGMVHGER